MRSLYRKLRFNLFLWLLNIQPKMPNFEYEWFLGLDRWFGEFVPTLPMLSKVLRSEQIFTNAPHSHFLFQQAWLSEFEPAAAHAFRRIVESNIAKSEGERRSFFKSFELLLNYVAARNGLEDFDPMIQQVQTHPEFGLALRFCNRDSFAQEGEDLVLKDFFPPGHRGFYVDIGAHHPYRFSNTAFFYSQGWRGINIDPDTGVKTLFDEIRPRDTNLELAIGEREGELTYHRFDEACLNTFVAERVQALEASTRYRCIGTSKVNINRLASVLDKHLPSLQTIDLMSIDVEGFEESILNSNDWQKYRPKVIIIELLKHEGFKQGSHPVQLFLEQQGYVFRASSNRNFIFELVSR
jgi:FkbM family methyltransferase